MTRLPALFVAVSLGIMIALQPGLNAEVARRFGSPVGAAFLSISTSFALCAIYILATRQGFPISALPSLPWYLLPQVYRADRDAYIARCGGFRVGGYLELIRRFGLTPVDAPVHPLARDRQT